LKQILLYLLLFSYTTVLFKPVLPALGDFVAHTFWRLEHISSIHIENGKQHLHYELIGLVKESTKEKAAANNFKADVFYTPHVIAQSPCYDFTLPQLPPADYRWYLLFFPSHWLQSDFPPPKAEAFSK